MLYESSSTALVRNAVHTMQRWGVLTADKRAPVVTLLPPYADGEELSASACARCGDAMADAWW
jgi:hypothetical protein